MTDPARIYRENAAEYERMVSCEDYEGNILAAIRRVRPLEGLDVVELGAGTGRLTCMLAPVVSKIEAYDISSHMLEVAAAKLQQSGLENWTIGVADHRALPVEDRAADLAIAGWSVVYTVVWHPERWQAELESALAEMKRVLRPGGTIIILETLGTGHETPSPPEGLTDYFSYLEREAGFISTWIRTDYLFRSPDEARELTAFFFGEEMVRNVIGTHPVILPECTGIWWQYL